MVQIKKGIERTVADSSLHCTVDTKYVETNPIEVEYITEGFLKCNALHW